MTSLALVSGWILVGGHFLDGPVSIGSQIRELVPTYRCLTVVLPIFECTERLSQSDPVPGTYLEIRDTELTQKRYFDNSDPTGEDYIKEVTELQRVIDTIENGKVIQRRTLVIRPGPHLRAVWGSNDQSVWAAGNEGTIVQWNGKDWLHLDARQRLFRLKGDADRLIGYRDGQWVYVDTDEPPSEIRISPTGRVKWKDGDWADPYHDPCPAIHDLWGTGPSQIWMVGQQGLIAHWNGQSWSTEQSPTQDTLRAIYGVDSSNIWIIGENGTLLSRSGENWTLLPSSTKKDLGDVYIQSSRTGFAVGDGATILSLKESSWTQATGPTRFNLNAVTFPSENFAWAVGDLGVGLRWNGIAWSLSVTTVSEHLLAISASDQTHLWAVGFHGTMVQSNGVSWTASTPITKQHLLDVWMANPTSAWAVGLKGTALQLNNGKWAISPTFLDQLVSEDVKTLDQGGNLKTSLQTLFEYDRSGRLNGVRFVDQTGKQSARLKGIFQEMTLIRANWQDGLDRLTKFARSDGKIWKYFNAFGVQITKADYDRLWPPISVLGRFAVEPHGLGRPQNIVSNQ